jgi:hypothetical protein
MEVNGQFYTTAALSPGKSPQYPGRNPELAFCNTVEHGVYEEINILANGCDSCTGHQDRMKQIPAPSLNRKHANVNS